MSTDDWEIFEKEIDSGSEMARKLIGDATNFLPYSWMSKYLQVPKLMKQFNCNEELALTLFDNGIFAPFTFYKPLEWGRKQPIALDTYYNREILVVDDNRNSNGLPRVTTAVDGEGYKIGRIRQKLVSVSPLKEQFLDYAIPMWSVSNRKELHHIIDIIQTTIDMFTGQHYKLWFRGQGREHILPLPRTTEINEWLGYSTEKKQISLMPSLARLALTDPQVRTFGWGKFGPLFRWEKPLLSWIFLSHPKWFPNPKFLEKVKEAVITEDIELFSRVLFDLEHAGLFDSEYGENDDDALEIFQTYWHRYGKDSIPLYCQHYGLPTSAVDITSDIEVAIFFMINRLDVTSGKFYHTNSIERKGAVIYIFAQATWPSGEYRHQFVSSQELTEKRGPVPIDIPLRIIRQKCGLLFGSDQVAWNLPADLVVAKILFDNFDEDCLKTQSELFPSRQEDSLYNILLECKPDLKDLVRYT